VSPLDALLVVLGDDRLEHGRALQVAHPVRRRKERLDEVAIELTHLDDVLRIQLSGASGTCADLSGRKV